MNVPLQCRVASLSLASLIALLCPVQEFVLARAACCRLLLLTGTLLLHIFVHVCEKECLRRGPCG